MPMFTRPHLIWILIVLSEIILQLILNKCLFGSSSKSLRRLLLYNLFEFVPNLFSSSSPNYYSFPRNSTSIWKNILNFSFKLLNNDCLKAILKLLDHICILFLSNRISNMNSLPQNSVTQLNSQYTIFLLELCTTNIMLSMCKDDR